jgi:dihydroorotate dehydrogenase
MVPAQPRLASREMGLWFPNPLGLAAGFDKDALALAGLACLGFGHIEIGAVTLRGQPGRPRPRVFRLEGDQGLINRMGFPNRGVDALVSRMRRRPGGPHVLGVNLGKGAQTPLERAPEEYAQLLRAVNDVADYASLNLSSPNTPGLRRLQSGAHLAELLSTVMRTRDDLAAAKGRRLPVTIKLSPDLDPEHLQTAVGVALAHGVDGIVAVNTTRARVGLTCAGAGEQG